MVYFRRLDVVRLSDNIIMHNEAPRRKSGRMIMLGVYNAAGYALRVTNKYGWALDNDQLWGYRYSGNAWELTHASNCDFASAIMNMSQIYSVAMVSVCISYCFVIYVPKWIGNATDFIDHFWSCNLFQWRHMCAMHPKSPGIRQLVRQISRLT